MSVEDLLFREYDQQYQQYRHLDNLREKYVAFYIAFIAAIFVYFTKTASNTNTESIISSNLDYVPLLTLSFLLIIGLFVLHIAISMRIAQRLTADHLMEIRKELIRILPSARERDIENKFGVCRSYLMATYKPHKVKPGERDKCIQCGWHWTESAIQLIWLLIIVNTIIGYYLIIKYQSLVLLAAFIFVQLLLLCYGYKLKFGLKHLVLVFFMLIISVVILSISLFYNIEYLESWKKFLTVIFLTTLIFYDQFWFFYWRFKWEFSSKKQKDREDKMRQYLQDVCVFPNETG